MVQTTSYTQEDQISQKTDLEKVLWADESKIALHQKDERRQTGEGELMI